MPSTGEKEGLDELDDTIAYHQRQLDNAMAARDAFLQHLKGKYPNWKPPLPSLTYPKANFSHFHTNHTRREPLLSRLATSDYQWDVDERAPRNPLRNNALLSKMATFAPPDIPVSGPLLESDLRRSKIRLREISEELRAMRMDRMSLSTEQWMQMDPFRQKTSRLNLNLRRMSEPEVDHLEEARARLANIGFTESSPVVTPTEERKMEIQMTEQHEQLMDDIRAGRVSMSDPIRALPEPVVSSVAVAPPVPAQPAPVVSAPEVAHVKFEEPVVAPPAVAAAPPSPPPAPQAPPYQSVLSGFLNQKFDSDSDDSFDAPRIPPAPKPVASTSATQQNAYESMLSRLRDDDDDDDSPRFDKPKSAPRSAMFQDDDSDEDFFN